MIAKVVFNLGVNKEFDYYLSSSLNAKVGSRVRVEFNKNIRTAVIVSFSKKTEVKGIKPVLSCLDAQPSLSREHIDFARRLSKEYICPLGEIVFMMLPPFLRKKSYFTENILNSTKKRPKEAIVPVFVKSNSFHKRFSIYKKDITAALRGNSVILCLPTVEHAERVFCDIDGELKNRAVLIHSYQRQKEHYRNWLRIKKGNVFIVSTRLGLFYYPADLSLIVVEEENSHYYFNPERPYYQLIDVAKILARLKNIPLILSGDYPRISTYKECKDKKMFLIEKKEEKKNLKVLHFSNFYKGRKRIFTPFTIELIRKNLEEGKKILILWNKNNFCSFLKCNNCGYIPMCLKCSSHLRISLDENKGVCSWCGAVYDIEKMCKMCSSGYIRPIGVGIERLEAITKRIFPEYKIARLKSLNTDADIVLSIPKVANYLYDYDYNLNIALVLDADHMLSSSDYNATYSTFIYLRKISNLVKDGVYIFTHNPGYYLWNYISGEWKYFYGKELRLRKEFNFPPYVRLVKITLRARNENKLSNHANSLYNNLREHSFCVLGPFKEFPFKMRGLYRYSIVAKFKKSKSFLKDINLLLEHYRRYSKIAVVVE